MTAIQKYETFHNDIEGINFDGDTDLQTIAETSLGIEGWALSNFGTENLMHAFRRR